MTMKVGFVGLGIMGRPMASNLLKAGFELWVYARRPVTMEVLVDAGAHSCSSAEEVALNTDVMVIMVAETSDVEQVIFGDRGLVRSARRGAVVVDMSTISPAATRRFAAELEARGIHMLDAPVSGGDVGAINATLSIMVGGKREIYDRLRPVFEALGKNIIHVGDHGAGQVAKACNNLVVALTMEAVAEAFAFARKHEVDAARVREALLGGFAASKVLEVHGRRMLERDFAPGFKARLHQKDLRIVMDEAAKLGLAMPGTALVAQHLNALVGAGDAELDSSAIVKVIESTSGLK